MKVLRIVIRTAALVVMSVSAYMTVQSLNRPYSMAHPHQSVWERAEAGVMGAMDSALPVLSAAPPLCECTEAKPMAPGQCGLNGTCTRYGCEYTGNTKKLCTLTQCGYPCTVNDPIYGLCSCAQNINCYTP
jgi:hypothetical protein